jgi:hypothetical protein
MLFQKICLSAAAAGFALIWAPCAMADPASCGLAPYQPALPSPTDIARMPPGDAATAKHQAFQDVVDWQKGLKTYRACLNTLINDDNRKITGDQNGSKDDKDEIAGLKTDIADINAIYNKTVDSEKSLVGSYNSIAQQYCSRKDVDLSSCQPAR